MGRQEEMWFEAPILSLPIRAIWSTWASPTSSSLKGGSLTGSMLPTPQTLAHDLPKFTTMVLYILLKRIQGVWKFSTRIHPSNLFHSHEAYFQMVTSGPGRVLKIGLTHGNKAPRVNVKMLVLNITLQNTQTWVRSKVLPMLDIL